MWTKKLQILFLLGLLFPFTILAQETEKEINAPIESVRIFLQGAEIIRNAKTALPKGKHKLIFTNLSPKVNPSSIQISTDGGEINMLSTTSKINFLKENNLTNPRIKILQDSMDMVRDEIQMIANQEASFYQEKKVMESNQILSGKEKAVDLQQLKETATYFRIRFLEINTELATLTKKKGKLQDRQRNIQQQLNELNAGRRPYSEIYLTVDCKTPVTTDFRLRYVVQGAGWSPIYDLTVNDLKEPIKIKYRALAFNDTGIDWENINVTLSTADPNQTATLPILTPWNLKENMPYTGKKDRAQIQSYEGRLNMNLSNQNVYQENKKKQYSNSPNQPITGNGVNIVFEEIEISELSNDFEIKDPYTIPSDRKPYSIIVNETKLNAAYQYYSVPKMDKDAFLLGQVTGWEDLDLMPGPMNIYYDKSFIGMAELNTRNLNDTLNLSLGRDPKVMVKRVKLKELTKKQFLQSKKKMSLAYKITVKNNRDQPIDFELLDQIPISNVKEIDVDVKEISGAKFFENTGKLKWNFKLKPGESRSVTFSFSITYPKNKEIVIEKNRTVVTPRYF